MVAAFGDDVLNPAGELDRKRVASIVFRDAVARAKLNAIVHPRIGALTGARAAELAARGEPLACYEAALIVENGLADMFRPLVVVSCPGGAPDRAHDRARRSDRGRGARAGERADAARVEGRGWRTSCSRTPGRSRSSRQRADAMLDQVCAMQKVDPSRYPRPLMTRANAASRRRLPRRLVARSDAPRAGLPRPRENRAYARCTSPRPTPPRGGRWSSG